jgi:pimeloyl-ACP methyl ester carboxylesterase
MRRMYASDLRAATRGALRATATIAAVSTVAGCGGGLTLTEPDLEPVVVRTSPPRLDRATKRAAARVTHGASAVLMDIRCPQRWHYSEIHSAIQVRCGRVIVPQHRRPEDASRRLAPVALPLMVFSTEAGRGGTPLIFLAGGPGESAIVSAQTILLNTPLGRRAVRERPIIVYDRRGYGAWYDRASPDLGFVSEATRGTRARTLERVHAGAAVAAGGLRRNGIDPRYFGTSDAVEDLRDVLTVLGVKRAILLGVSYGTRDALQFMRRYPHMVEAAVLDGVAPPQSDSVFEPHFVMESRRRVALRVARSCIADSICQAEHPDLAAAIERLTRPDARPLVLTAMTEGMKRPRTVAVLPSVLLATLGAAAGFDDVRAAVPQLLGAIASGDTLRDRMASDLALTAADPARTEGPWPVYPLVYYAVLCADSPRGVPRVGGRAICEAMDVPFGGAELTAPVRSDVPTLLLSSGNDSQTPPALAAEAARTLTRGYHVHFPDVGHVVVAQPLSAACAAIVVESFLAHPRRAPQDACRVRAAAW